MNKVYYDNTISPGTIGVDVTLSTVRNVYNVFTATVGNLSMDFYICGGTSCQ